MTADDRPWCLDCSPRVNPFSLYPTLVARLSELLSFAEGDAPEGFDLAAMEGGRPDVRE